MLRKAIKISFVTVALTLASLATPAIAGEFVPISMAAYQAAAAKGTADHLPYPDQGRSGLRQAA